MTVTEEPQVTGLPAVVGAFVARWSREVVVKRAAIIAAVTLLLNLAVGYGWLTPDWSAKVVGVVTALIGAAGLLVGAVSTRKVVTPTSDPRGDDGEPMMPVAEHIAALAAASEHRPQHATPDA